MLLILLLDFLPEEVWELLQEKDAAAAAVEGGGMAALRAGGQAAVRVLPIPKELIEQFI
jgi:hypothetical protein